MKQSDTKKQLLLHSRRSPIIDSNHIKDVKIRSDSYAIAASFDSDNFISNSFSNHGLSKCLDRENNNNNNYNHIYDNIESVKNLSKSKKETTLDASVLSHNLLKAIKAVKSTVKYLNKEKKDLSQIEAFRIEWKEAARRIDSVMFFACGLTVLLTPLFLFSAYVYEKPLVINECKCHL